MDLFLDVCLKVTLPIVALVGIGYLAQLRLKFDVASLNRLLVFVVMPCFLIHYLSSADQPISEVWPTIYFTLVQFLFLIPIGWLLAMIFRLKANYTPIVAMATVYANVGNYGIPLVQLAFPPDFILHQSVITSLMTILIVTVGAWLLAPAAQRAGPLARLKVAFETPTIPAVLIGLALRAADYELPPVIGTPIELTGSIFAPLALLALGAQLAANSAGRLDFGPLTLVLLLKLAIAPAVTWALAIWMGIPDQLTDLFVVAAATPVGVLLVVFCTEYKRHPNFVATAILVSTALSPLTVTGWILLTRIY